MDKEVMANAFKRIVEKDGSLLEFVPTELIDEEMCIYAVWDDSKAFKFVPENMRGAVLAKMPYEFRAYTGILWWKVLEDIPKELLSTEICKQALEKEVKYFPGVPEEYIDEEMCMSVVQKRGDFLEYVPQKFRTYEICKEAIKESGMHAIDYVPEDKRTSDLYTLLVKQNTEYFKSIDIDTDEKQWLAERLMDPIEIIPKEIQTAEMYEMIGEKYPYPKNFLDIVPKEFMDKNFWMQLIEKNGRYLGYAPSNIIDNELYLKAIQSYPDGIGWFIPKEKITRDMYIEAFKQGVELDSYYDEDYEELFSDEELARFEEWMTPEVYCEILKDTDCFYRIPKEKRTFDVYVCAAQNDRIRFKDIPEEISSDRKFWKAVIDKNTNFLKYAPKDMITPEICEKAMEDSPRNIANIPEEFRTLDICKAAMLPRRIDDDDYYSGYDSHYFKYIPKEYIMEFVPNANTGIYDGLKLDKLFEYVPEDRRTEKFYIKLLSYGDEGIKHIPEELLNSQEFWKKVVENSVYEFDAVPDKYKTKAMCIEAVKGYADNFKHVPENLIDKEIYEALVDGRARKVHLSGTRNILKDIPAKYITPEIYAKGIYGGDKIDEKVDLDIMLKMYKFDKIHHFVPGVSVLRKYPIDQIEKFDKKIWWHLTKNGLYNSSDDAKNALVEALLSFGAFEKDENQEERVGMIEHFATYLPKKRFKISLDNFLDSEKEIINNNFDIKKYNKYVVNTEKMLEEPDFLSLFESQEKADEELDYIIWEVLGGTELSETQMKNALEEYGVDTNENAVIRYVLQKGYDKQIDENNVGILLKTDLQELKSNNPEEGYELEKRIRKIYYKADPSFMMTPTKLHRIFDGMDMKYKPDFYEFFKNNTTEILKNQKKQNEISKIQKQWDEIVNANLGQRITFDKCEKFIYEKRYKNVEFADIGKLASNCGYSQEQFERVQDIYREQLKRKESSIPQIEGKCKDSKYTYKVLRLDDPTALFVGELTDCCQAIDDAGESCMIHSTTSPNGRVLIVQDESGKVLAQSWLWRNKNVICFDNIEAVQKDSNNKKVVSNEILKAVKKAAKAFVEEDKTGIKKYEQEEMSKLEEEKANMTNGEYEKKVTELRKTIKGQQLNKVTVGIGYTDIDISKLKHDDENKYPEESVDYIHDSRIQLVLYEDSSVEHEDSADDIKTVTALYSDNEKSKKVINLDTSEIEYIGTYIEDELDEYEEDIENEDEMIDFEEGYIDMGEIETVINHPQDRAKARQALENIKEYLRSREGMEI